MKEKIKWGILGLGKIANKFVKGLAAVNNAEIYAVASRDREKALSFAKTYYAPLAYGSYKQLMEDDNVDVVYIATPHVFHYDLTLDCIKNGKAVLCEKPFAMNSEEAKKMVDLSRSEGVFLMEALWTMFLPHFQFVLKKVNSGELGKPRSLKADFGFQAEFDESKRLFNKSLGGGSLLDIGIYPVFLAYTLFGKPKEINARARFSETGVDTTCHINFKYPEGIEADLSSSLLENTPTTAEIELEKGKIVLHSRFHEPTSVTIISNDKEETLDFEVETNGYFFEADHVTKMLMAGKTESEVMNLDRTLDLMELLDKIRDEIGLSYQ